MGVEEGRGERRRVEEEQGGGKDAKKVMHPENENFQRWNHLDRQ